MAVFYANGNDIKQNTVDKSVDEEQSGVNMEVLKCLMGDSALQSSSMAVLRSAGDSVQLVSVNKPKAPKCDTVSVATEPKAEVEPSKPLFKSRIIWGGGRDRYGAFTEECAAYVNGRLSKIGVYSSGHAYQIPPRFKLVLNGYTGQTLPNVQNLSFAEAFQKVLELHRKAADYIKENLDISQLDTTKCYVVNMYYNTSQYMVQFYKESRWCKTGNYATHVGFVYYDQKEQAWIVDHNIHGNVHRDALEMVLGGRSNPKKYGVTTIYQVTKRK